MKRKICVVTGTRAEFGILHNLMKTIDQETSLELQIIATGMHLSPEFGLTYRQIEDDGFTINEKVEMLLSSDTASGVVKSMGLANIGYADALQRLKPDLLVILGDRFEMLAAAQSALIMQIPIAHIHGGECTYGAYDDAMRHAITKMSTWHFTSSETHRKRVIQLGEHPDRIWVVGALGIENILSIPFLTRKDLFENLKLKYDKEMFLITYHPETNGDSNGIDDLLAVLDQYSDVNLVFTKSNADNGGRQINEKLYDYTQQRQNAFLFDSLGQLRYLSAVKHAKAVIGNSSSALIEVPYLHTPSVNIGDRQAGRERPNSIFDAQLSQDSIQKAIHQALMFTGPYEHIFGDGKVAKKIVKVLQEINDYKIQKEFYDL